MCPGTESRLEDKCGRTDPRTKRAMTHRSSAHADYTELNIFALAASRLLCFVFYILCFIFVLFPFALLSMVTCQFMILFFVFRFVLIKVSVEELT